MKIRLKNPSSFGPVEVKDKLYDYRGGLIGWRAQGDMFRSVELWEPVPEVTERDVTGDIAYETDRVLSLNGRQIAYLNCTAYRDGYRLETVTCYELGDFELQDRGLQVFESDYLRTHQVTRLKLVKREEGA